MTADDARARAIEAGAKALESTDFDFYPCDHGAYMQTCTKCLAAAVLAAVEPIIRADERERVIADCHGDWIIGLADLRAKADECSTVGEVLALLDEVQP